MKIYLIPTDYQNYHVHESLVVLVEDQAGEIYFEVPDSFEIWTPEQLNTFAVNRGQTLPRYILIELDVTLPILEDLIELFGSDDVFEIPGIEDCIRISLSNFGYNGPMPDIREYPDTWRYNFYLSEFWNCIGKNLTKEDQAEYHVLSEVADMTRRVADNLTGALELIDKMRKRLEGLEDEVSEIKSHIEV